VPAPNHDSQATKLIGGETRAADLLNTVPVRHPDMIDNLPLRIAPAYYDLAQAENRLLIEWLFGERPADIRYLLAQILHDPVVQKNFSRIVIDAPPRLTTACVQALCAATHVVIPTVLDRLSVEAVGTFIGQLETLKSGGVCPYLKYGGIIGYNPGRTERQVGDAEDSIRDALRKHKLDEKLYIDDPTLVHRPLIAECAGQTIAYARIGPASEVKVVREMFARLAAEIEARMKG
jgi:cellulose biosynthesis protein BcsQ